MRFCTRGVHAQSELDQYLVEHQGQATYLVATINASTAAPFILDTGKAVMALGGFNSFDTILTAQQVAALVARGRVRFFLLPCSRIYPCMDKPQMEPSSSFFRSLAPVFAAGCTRRSRDVPEPVAP